MIEIHQFVPNFCEGDAIASSVIELQKIFQSLGYKSLIFAVSIEKPLRKKAYPYKKYLKFSHSKNLVFYHLSDSSPLTEFFKNLPDRKIIVYHNITPQEFFKQQGLFYPDKREEEVLALSEITEFAFGVSEFNRKCLENFGFKKTGVLPIIFNPEKYSLKEINQKILEKFKDGKINILFVGRIAPNKKIEDLIRIFYFYKKYLNTESRLIIAGKVFELFEPYYGKLLKLVEELDLKDDLIFTGHVALSDLIAYYQIADLYLSASEHEGFGLPFLEAMFFKVPIVAFSAGAIPETLGGAGILYKDKEPHLVAEIIAKVLKDEKLKEKLVYSEQKRVKEFFPENVKKIIENWLRETI